MLAESLSNIFAVSDLRKRVLFTLGLLAVYRVGSHIPTPGVNSEALALIAEQAKSTMFGLYDMFSGQNLSQMTIFALGIMPYISASIILQLLTVVWPYLERLKNEGVDLRGHTKIARVDRSPSGVAVILEGGERLEGSHLLVAAGRAPVVEGLDLDKAGVAHTAKGITVDASLRTSNRNVWAIGDCNGLYAFTHMAGYEASLFIRGALFRAPARLDAAIVPWATYTDPELAQVGLSERQARDKHGDAIKVLRWKLAENDRAQTERKTEGMVKAITDRPVLVVEDNPETWEAGS